MEAPIEAELLSASDVARFLSVSLRQVRNLDYQGLLPIPLRLKGSVRWSRSELRAWIAAGTPKRETWELQKRMAATAR